MSGIVAYHERVSSDPMTGVEGILRSEWRVRKVADFPPETLTAQWGEGWRQTRPFAEYVLEHRIIRRGKEEPWTPFDAANSLSQALEYIDDSATAIHPTLKRLQAERKAHREQEHRDAEQKRLAEIEAEERSRTEWLSEQAFRRLMNGKQRAWGERWIAFVEAHSNDAAFKQGALDNPEFMKLYRAILHATKVPTKISAIKAFLLKFA